MSTFAETRLHSRKELLKPIVLELFVPFEGQGNVQIEAMGIDISSGGIGITTRHAMSSGEVMKVSYPLNGDTITLPVYSEVVWSVLNEGGCRAGLRFLN